MGQCAGMGMRSARASARWLRCRHALPPAPSPPLQVRTVRKVERVERVVHHRYCAVAEGRLGEVLPWLARAGGAHGNGLQAKHHVLVALDVAGSEAAREHSLSGSTGDREEGSMGAQLALGVVVWHQNKA